MFATKDGEFLAFEGEAENKGEGTKDADNFGEFEESSSDGKGGEPRGIGEGNEHPVFIPEHQDETDGHDSHGGDGDLVHLSVAHRHG